MKFRKVLFFAVTICLVLSMNIVTKGLNIYGKLAGRVVDNSTNQPLAGVNIIIKGTTLGAATNEEGRYTNLQVPPGTYEVELSFIGYKTITVQEVIVHINLTTTVYSNLEEIVLDISENVVVVAERSLVIPDQTSSSSRATGDEIEDIPQISTVQDLIGRPCRVLSATVNRSMREVADRVKYFTLSMVCR